MSFRLSRKHASEEARALLSNAGGTSRLGGTGDDDSTEAASPRRSRPTPPAPFGRAIDRYRTFGKVASRHRTQGAQRDESMFLVTFLFPASPSIHRPSKSPAVMRLPTTVQTDSCASLARILTNDVLLDAFQVTPHSCSPVLFM